ncbi:MAG: undecaprenyl-diphosphate phosphatase [Dehalococcoidia bacterium]
MDDYLRAILLGAVQAVTEFLPISSSGHLILAPEILGEESSPLTFDVGLHVGTLVAVLGYFWRDWVRIAVATLHDAGAEGVAVRRWSPDARLGLLLALGTVPAVIVGFALEGWIEENVRDPLVVAAMLIGVGVLIGVADRYGPLVLRLADMTPARSLLIGCAQAAALIPGVSRSGATIATSRALGFDRPSAARFSFLLSAPIVAGAGALRLTEALTGEEAIQWGPLLVGAVTSAAVGALVIRVFLSFVQRATLAVFVWYRIALGLAVIAAVATGIL